MNWPNRLTVLRIALIPVFVTLFFLPFPYLKFASLGVFLLAALTDVLDGKIARKYNLVTKVGNFLDTIADKMLITCAMICVAVDFAMLTESPFSTSPLPQPYGIQWIFVVSNPGLDYLFTALIAACVMINICRDLMISALKMIASAKGVNISADKLGKIKMVLQTASLVFLIPFMDLIRIVNETGHLWLSASVFLAGAGLLATATLMALISGINYVIKYRYVFKEED